MSCLKVRGRTHTITSSVSRQECFHARVCFLITTTKDRKVLVAVRKHQQNFAFFGEEWTDVNSGRRSLGDKKRTNLFCSIFLTLEKLSVKG